MVRKRFDALSDRGKKIKNNSISSDRNKGSFYDIVPVDLRGIYSIENLGVKKNCEKCGQSFHTGKRKSRVLCPVCKTELKNLPESPLYTGICSECNNPFTAKRSDAENCGKYRCRKALYRKIHPQKKKI